MRHLPYATSPSLTLPVPLPPACLFRFNVLSLVYLLFLLLLPWFPGPSRGSAGGKGLSLGRGDRAEEWAALAGGVLGSVGAANRSAAGTCPPSPCGFTPAGQRGSAWQPRSVNYSPVRLLIGFPTPKWPVLSPSLINQKPQGWAVPRGMSSPSALPGDMGHVPRGGHAGGASPHGGRAGASPPAGAWDVSWDIFPITRWAVGCP